MTILAILAVILLVAFLVESLTEYFFGALVANVPALTKWKWCMMYVSALIGVMGAFVYRFDLVYLMGEFVGIPVAEHPMGIILTGLSIGRGANYIHDIWIRYFKKPEPAPAPEPVIYLIPPTPQP